MAKSSSGKRPCCICRKWFTPDVRQKGRQTTCGCSACKSEQHRRNCQKWNKRNGEYFKNNYLGKKLEKLEEKASKEFRSSKPSYEHPPPNCLAKPVLPYEILENEYGTRNMIIMQYVAWQIVNQSYDSKNCVHIGGCSFMDRNLD